MRIMGHSVEDGVGHQGVGEDGRPVGDGPVAGEDEAFGLVTGIDDGVKEFGLFGGDFFEGEVVDGEEVNSEQFFQVFVELVVEFGAFEFGEEVVEAVEGDRELQETGLVAEGLRQVRSAGTGGADEKDVFAAGDEFTGGELADVGGVDGGVGGEVEAVQGLGDGDAGAVEQALDFVVGSPVDFIGKQQREELGIGELILLGLLHTQLQVL